MKTVFLSYHPPTLTSIRIVHLCNSLEEYVANWLAQKILLLILFLSISVSAGGGFILSVFKVDVAGGGGGAFWWRRVMSITGVGRPQGGYAGIYKKNESRGSRSFMSFVDDYSTTVTFLLASIVMVLPSMAMEVYSVPLTVTGSPQALILQRPEKSESILLVPVVIRVKLSP